jgi:hypothetical protein
MHGALPLRAPRLRLITRERRRTPRVSGPFMATWPGASAPCRVPDLSVHGCYVASLSTPPVGALITLTFVTDQTRTLPVKGEVQAVDPGIGFSVLFVETPDDDLEALAAWVGSRAAK